MVINHPPRHDHQHRHPLVLRNEVMFVWKCLAEAWATRSKGVVAEQIFPRTNIEYCAETANIVQIWLLVDLDTFLSWADIVLKQLYQSNFRALEHSRNNFAAWMFHTKCVCVFVGGGGQRLIDVKKNWNIGGGGHLLIKSAAVGQILWKAPSRRLREADGQRGTNKKQKYKQI